MNWFKHFFKLIFASNNLRLEQVKGPDGKDYTCILGNTFPIKSQLSRLGFRWNAERYLWYMESQSYNANPSLPGQLAKLGIPVDGQIPLPVPPKMPQQSQQTQKTWYLATFLTDNQPIAVCKNGNLWDWLTEEGMMGSVEDAAAKDTFKSIRDANGNPYTSNDPKQLFNIFKQQNQNEIQEQPKPENTVPGRIPEDRISKYQKGIENSFLQTKESIMVNALAGSGKTATLRHLASFKNPNEKWLYLVFNKKNQTESSTGKGKFPNGVEVLTSHAFLGKVLNKSADLNSIPKTEIWYDAGERTSAILDSVLEHDNTFPFNLKFAAKRVIHQVVTKCKACSVNPHDKDSMEQVLNVIKQYSIDCDLSTEKTRSDRDWTPQIADKALDLLDACLPGRATDPKFAGLRDHDDTLWYAAINNNLNWPKYDVVLADEVQDFNKCQTIMLQKLAAAGARIVAVGDPNQSIYLFRGADAHAFENVQSTLMGVQNGNVQHQLPVNYRSGRNIIKFVNENTHVKDLIAGRDFDGEVTTDRMYDDVVPSLADEQSTQGKLKQQTAMIARTNAPLVSAALDLMRSNIDFSVIGRDFSKEFTDQVERVTGKGRFAKIIPINSLEYELTSYVSNLEQKWAGKISKSAQLKDMKDATDALLSVLEYLRMNNFYDPKVKMRVNDSSQFVAYIRARFSGVNTDNAEDAAKLQNRDPLSFVTLTSAHRSKGLEFDRVFVLKPQLFPHPRAKTADELQQEGNAKYVCFTRAMRELHVLIHPDKKVRD